MSPFPIYRALFRGSCKACTLSAPKTRMTSLTFLLAHSLP